MLDQKYEDGGDAEFNRRGLRVAGSADGERGFVSLRMIVTTMIILELTTQLKPSPERSLFVSCSLLLPPFKSTAVLFFFLR